MTDLARKMAEKIAKFYATFFDPARPTRKCSIKMPVLARGRRKNGHY